MSSFRVLVVCSANVCRSPLAAAVLRAGIGSAPGDGVVVESAGVDAVHGAEPCSAMTAAAKSRGLDLDLLRTHRSRPLTREQIAEADLVLVMDRTTRAHVLRHLPSSHGRTFTLRQAARLLAIVDGLAQPSGRRPAAVAPPLADLVRELDLNRSLAGPSQAQRVRVPGRPWRRITTNTLDVPDAHGDRNGDHRATFTLLVAPTRRLAVALAQQAQR